MTELNRTEFRPHREAKLNSSWKFWLIGTRRTWSRWWRN